MLRDHLVQVDDVDMESQSHLAVADSFSTLPSRNKTLTKTCTTTSASANRQTRLQVHKRLWFFGLILVLILSVGSGLLVGFLAHRADLGIMTTTDVAEIVAFVEAFLFKLFK
jgi:hypothetical protein